MRLTKKHAISIFLLISYSHFIVENGLKAQEKVFLWKYDAIPNNTGIKVSDSISNERMYRVEQPYIQIFEPVSTNKNRVAVLIIPGGAYSRLAYEISGISLAKWLNSLGITAYVLYHRLPQAANVKISYIAPLQDAQRAMRIIRTNAVQFGIDKNKIGVLGTSAGGHLASCLCTLAPDWSLNGDSLDNVSYKPDFSILISPVISMADSIVHKETRWNLLGGNANNKIWQKQFSTELQINSATPLALLIHADNDPAVSVLNSLVYYNALIKSGVKGSALHVFPLGGHSISLSEQPGSTKLWTEITNLWIKETINLRK